MSKLSYNVVWHSLYPFFWISSRPIVRGLENTTQPGPFLLAPTHLSYFDVPCLMAVTPRYLDFLSIVEMWRKPLVRRFYNMMNTFYVDRGRVDTAAVRTILDRLEKGRVVTMFPEGNIRRLENSVISGGPLKPGAARIAQLANVPIVPAVVLNTGAYMKWTSWLPLRRTRYGVIFGKPLHIRTDLEKTEARAALEEELRTAYRQLYAVLQAEMEKPK